MSLETIDMEAHDNGKEEEEEVLFLRAIQYRLRFRNKLVYINLSF